MLRHASATALARHVRVTHHDARGSVPLTKAAAVAYLAALDGGFVGRHDRLPELRARGRRGNI